MLTRYFTLDQHRHRYAASPFHSFFIHSNIEPFRNRGRAGLARRAPGEDRRVRGLRPEHGRCRHAEYVGLSLFN
jgi:hypothetical protein